MIDFFDEDGVACYGSQWFMILRIMRVECIFPIHEMTLNLVGIHRSLSWKYN